MDPSYHTHARKKHSHLTSYINTMEKRKLRCAANSKNFRQKLSLRFVLPEQV